MRFKISPKQALLIVVPLGFIFFAALFLYFIPQNPIRARSASVIENATALQNQEQASVGLPVRLEIPVIGVDSAVIPVGLTPDGAMDVPKGPAEVAWFNLGPHPGENGSAVIAGHYGWKNGIPAVFDNLSKLHKGDKVYVVDKNGATTTFVVRKVRTFGENEDASAVFGSSDGKAHLNLVTCEGVWNAAKKSYSDRLIVFTDKE